MLPGSPSVCWCPPFVCSVVPLNGGGGWCCVLPRVWIGSSLLYCPTLFCIVLPSFALFHYYLLSSLLRLCVRCYSIVGLGLCLCGRVVSLWNGGVGLCWVEGRVVSIVYTSSVCGVHFRGACVVLCVSVWCVRCFVVLCCGMTVGERECGGVWSRRLSSSSFSLLWCSG